MPDPARSVDDVGFAAFARRWFASQVYRPNTAATVESYLRNHVLPAFGDWALTDLRPSDVQAWVRSRGETLAPASVEVAFRVLSGIMSAAEADGLVPRNPCRGVRLPRVERAPVVPLSVVQVEALRAAMPPRLRAIVVLAAGTGLRHGECTGLTVDRVDFDARVVTVDRTLVTPVSGDAYLGPPKSRSSYRRVPMPDVVAAALRAHLARFEPGRHGLLFTTGAGRPIRRHRFGEVWRAAVVRAGLPRGIRFHELRHFYASLLIQEGESVKVVQARLGHASATETLDIYAHLWPDDGNRTRAAVDGLLGSLAEGTLSEPPMEPDR
ncbi:MAG TPA: site-specific integrase [Acidimicrobiia bacterium]|nr:site-specific integrase [Acidimicrobiia bacterium]